MQTLSMVEAALEYEKLGLFVLPIIPKTKKPYTEWAKRREFHPTPKEIIQWWYRWPNACVGIATGKWSGVDVVDVDGPAAKERLIAMVGEMPQTISQKTGRPEGGLQLFFKYNNNGLKNNAIDGLDLRTTGGIAVLPPSLHKTGNTYQWLSINPVEHGFDDLLEMPEEIVNYFKTHTKGNGENKKLISLEPVAPGVRNETLTRLVGKWVSDGMNIETAYYAASGWNNSLPQPLDDKEVRATVESIFKTDERNHPERHEIIEEEDTLSFPQNVMGGVAGKFARLYSQHLEPPIEFFYMAFLTCLGVVLADRLSLNTEIQPQPRFFTILLGESADDRKSTAIKKTVGFFKQTIDEFPTCWGVGSAEGLQKRFEDGNRLLLCLDEFKAFVGKCKIDASVLLPCVNTLFEINNYESWTKKTQVCLREAHLSLLAASTVQTYERTWDASFTDIGFNNRLFLLVPGAGQKKHSFPSRVPDHRIDRLKTDLQKVLLHTGYHPQLDLTGDAKQMYHHWYMNLDRSIHTKRLDTYALRLMGLIAVNELKNEVDVDIICKVLEICNWQYAVRQIHDPIDADNATANMEEKIRRQLKKGPLSDARLKQSTNANRAGLFFYNQAKNNLMHAKEVGWDKKLKKYVYRKP